MSQNEIRSTEEAEIPVVKDKRFKKEFAQELFDIAKNDLQAARTLDADFLVRKETAMLMIQQCIEKGLKALLCHYEVPIPQSHDLSLLIDRMQSTAIAIPHLIAATDFDELTPFATLRRYEDGHFEITQDDMIAALSLAESVMDWVSIEISK